MSELADSINDDSSAMSMLLSAVLTEEERKAYAAKVMAGVLLRDTVQGRSISSFISSSKQLQLYFSTGDPSSGFVLCKIIERRALLTYGCWISRSTMVNTNRICEFPALMRRPEVVGDVTSNAGCVYTRVTQRTHSSDTATTCFISGASRVISGGYRSPEQTNPESRMRCCRILEAPAHTSEPRELSGPALRPV